MYLQAAGACTDVALPCWCAERDGSRQHCLLWLFVGVEPTHATPLCSNVSYDASSRFASFQTTHLAPLALLVSRTRLLPYSAWHVRPTGGRNGNSAAITLDLPGLGERVVLEVGKGTAALTEPTTWPQLESLVGVAMAPLDLLQVSGWQRGAGACCKLKAWGEAA